MQFQTMYNASWHSEQVESPINRLEATPEMQSHYHKRSLKSNMLKRDTGTFIDGSELGSKKKKNTHQLTYYVRQNVLTIIKWLDRHIIIKLTCYLVNWFYYITFLVIADKIQLTECIITKGYT